VRLSNGRVMSQNTNDCLRLMAKCGFISRGIWRDYFAQGGTRWHRRQLQYLCKRSLIEPHPNPKASDCYVLSKVGKIILAREGLHFVQPPFVGQLGHDELIVRSVLELVSSRLICGYRFESEMRALDARQHLRNANMRTEDQRFADALLEVNVLGKRRILALEYERTSKSSRRYRDKLWSYSQSSSIWVVIFICESDGIRSAIKRQMSFLSSPLLDGKIGFVLRTSWIRGPADAPIALENQNFSIRSLVAPTEDLEEVEDARHVAL
jgi:hypothetical protein